MDRLRDSVFFQVCNDLTRVLDQRHNRLCFKRENLPASAIDLLLSPVDVPAALEGKGRLSHHGESPCDARRRSEDLYLAYGDLLYVRTRSGYST